MWFISVFSLEGVEVDEIKWEEWTLEVSSIHCPCRGGKKSIKKIPEQVGPESKNDLKLVSTLAQGLVLAKCKDIRPFSRGFTVCWYWGSFIFNADCMYCFPFFSPRYNLSICVMISRNGKKKYLWHSHSPLVCYTGDRQPVTTRGSSYIPGAFEHIKILCVHPGAEPSNSWGEILRNLCMYLGFCISQWLYTHKPTQYWSVHYRSSQLM